MIDQICLDLWRGQERTARENEEEKRKRKKKRKRKDKEGNKTKM